MRFDVPAIRINTLSPVQPAEFRLRLKYLHTSIQVNAAMAALSHGVHRISVVANSVAHLDRQQIRAVAWSGLAKKRAASLLPVFLKLNRLAIFRHDGVPTEIFLDSAPQCIRRAGFTVGDEGFSRRGLEVLKPPQDFDIVGVRR